jgi:integrase/recombinase XerD
MNASTHDITDHYENELRVFKIVMLDSGRTALTQKEYMLDIRKFLKSMYPKAIRDIGKIDIMAHLSEVRSHGSGDGTRNRKLSSLRAFFGALKEYDMVQSNPAQDVKKSRTVKNSIPVFLEENELEAFISLIDGRYSYRNMAICLLMGYAGLRVGEIQSLTIDQFQPSVGLRVLGKGRKWRVIPLPEALVTLLQKYIEHERMQPSSSKEQAIFISQFKRKISVRMIQLIAEKTFQLLKEEHPHLKNKKLSCHKLRHSFATNQIRSGTDIRTLQVMLGHESIETTQIYTHVSNKQVQEAMGRVTIPMITP